MRNGSGTYSLPVNSWNPATNGVSATAADWQSLINDVATALTASLAADGQTPMTGNLAMGNNRLIGLAAGSATGQSLRWEQLFSQGVEADIASATTTSIGAQNTNFLRVTGTTTITGLGTVYSGPRFLRFAGALTLTHGSALILPTGADITTAAGDLAIAVPKATTGTPDGWIVFYQRASGAALVPGVVPGAITSSGLTQATARMLGRTTAGVGAIEEMTAATVAAFVAAASDSAQGVVELATSAEVATGTDTSRAVTPAAMQASKLVVAAMQTATGTSVPFTSIPSWVKRITITFSGVSLDGANQIVVQLGDSGGLENSGYLGSAGVIQNAGASTTATFTSGFGIVTGNALNVLHGQMVLTLMDAATNLWASSHGIGWSNVGVTGHGGGTKALTSTLDRVSILPTAGNFDAGNIGLVYE